MCAFICIELLTAAQSVTGVALMNISSLDTVSPPFPPQISVRDFLFKIMRLVLHLLYAWRRVHMCVNRRERRSPCIRGEVFTGPRCLISEGPIIITSIAETLCVSNSWGDCVVQNKHITHILSTNPLKLQEMLNWAWWHVGCYIMLDYSYCGDRPVRTLTLWGWLGRIKIILNKIFKRSSLELLVPWDGK